MDNIQYQEIPYGLAGIDATIEEMKKFVAEYSGNWDVIRLAREIINGEDPRDPQATGDKIFWWVKKNIRFTKDPYIYELIQSPRVTLKYGTGDCDDFVILMGSLNAAIGNRIRFKTVGRRANMLDHVFLQVETNKGWRTYDAVVTESVPGWHPPIYANEKTYSVELDGIKQLGNFFDKIYEELKRFERRIREEASRFETRIRTELSRIETSIREEVSRVARKVRDEKRRLEDRVVEEFQRWEEKYGAMGKWMTFGAKVLAFGAVGPGFDLLLQKVDNPFKMTREEQLMFIQIGAVIGSAVISVVTLGGAAPLLATSILNLAGTAASLVSVRDQIEARKELIERLKQESIRFALEERVQREAIRKLEMDIALLEEIAQYQEGAGAAILAFQQAENARLEQLQAVLVDQGNEEIAAFANQVNQYFAAYEANLYKHLAEEEEKLYAEKEELAEAMIRFEEDFIEKKQHPMIYQVKQGLQEMSEGVNEMTEEVMDKVVPAIEKETKEVEESVRDVKDYFMKAFGR